jgi:hypothetical protein
LYKNPNPLLEPRCWVSSSIFEFFCVKIFIHNLLKYPQNSPKKKSQKLERETKHLVLVNGFQIFL